MLKKLAKQIKSTYLKHPELYKNLLIIVIYLILPFLFFKDAFHLNSIIHGHGDAMAQFFPNRQVLYNSLREFSIPLWAPLNYAGMPFLADIQNGSLYLINIIAGLIFPIILAFNFTIFIHYSLAGIFTYFFVKEYKISSLAAFTSGLIFMFSGFMVIRQTHSTMIFTAVWLPLILMLIKKYAKTKNFKYIILGSIFFAQQFFAGNTQVFLYCCCIEFIYIIYIFFSESNFKEKKVNFFILKFILIFGFGFLLILVQLLPTYELMKLSFRDKLSYENFTQFSFRIKQIPMLFFPYIFGKVNPLQYKDVASIFQSNYLEEGMYLGTFTFFISIAGFFKKHKDKYFWGIIALVSFLLIFGKNLPFYKLTYYLPLLNIFRIPSRHWVEFCFAFAVLGGFGFDYIIRSKFKEFKKMSLIIIALILSFVSGFFILYYFFKRAISSGDTFFLNYEVGFLFQSFSLNKLSIYIPLALFTASLLAFIILIFLKKKSYLQKKFILIPIVLLIFIDLFSFGHDFEPIPARNLEPLFNKNYYDTYNYIGKDNDIFRVYPLFYNTAPYDFDLPVTDISGNLNIFYDIYNITGYQAFYLKDYNKITKMDAIGLETDPNFNLISNNNVLSILNTKYILIPNELIRMFGVTPYLSKVGFKKSSEIINNKILSKSSNNSFIKFNEADNSFVFDSDNNELKIITVPIDLKSNTYYSVKFKIKKISNSNNLESVADKNIHFDFYGTKKNIVVYDNPEQEYIFPFESVGSDFQEYEAYINSGSIPDGTDTHLRIFCWNSSGIAIKDFKLFEDTLTKDASYTAINQVKDSLLLKNNKFFPRFYFAKNILDVDNISQVENNLWDTNFNPQEYTMVENYGLSKNQFNEYKSNEVYLLKYENNYVDLRVSMKEDGFLVFSDTYYPGWRAYIDGKVTKIYKTNGTLKGIYIPAGEHKIRSRFLPSSFIIGAAISGATFIFLIVFLMAQLKKKKRDKESMSIPEKIL